MLINRDERHGDIFELHAFWDPGRHTQNGVNEQARFTGDARVVKDDWRAKSAGSQYNQVSRDKLA